MPRIVLTILVAAFVCACQPAVQIPATLHTPEVVGVVTAVTPGVERVRTYTLADGSVVTLDGAKYTDIKGSGNASIGDLVLTDRAATWMSSLRINKRADAPPGCFNLANGGVDDGDYIKFENGLRLPKAVDFDPGRAQNGVYQIPLVEFCVDASGAVTKYRS